MHKTSLALALALTTLAPTCGPSQPEAAPTSDEAAVTPRARLRISGQLQGYLEPCGCADNQLGGLARRAFKLREDRRYDVLIEGGNAVATATELDVEKLLQIFTVLDDSDARYDAVAVGPRDLLLPDDSYLAFAEGFGFPVVSADLVRPGADAPWPIVTHVERAPEDAATVRIAALTMSAPDGFEVRAPADAWRDAMAGAAPETLRVLVAHTVDEGAAELAALEPKPDLLVLVNGAHTEPLAEFRTVAGVPVVHTGSRGKYLVDVTLTRNADGGLITRYDPVPLSGSRTAKGAMQDPDVDQLLIAHRHQVKELGLREALARQLPTPTQAEYVGSKACAECHVTAYEVWKNSKHGHAWHTLEQAEGSEKYPWPVTHYPDCVGCHVVGYQQVTGFVNPTETPLLKDVGCEECHGPGSEHVDFPERGQFVEQTPDLCTKCHDHEQTPMFLGEYQRYWKQIEHGYDPVEAEDK